MALDIDKINDSDHILDLLLKCEDVLDNCDVYCFLNWISGELVDGPNVRRHWISISLLYKHDQMPDPRAAKRLMKLGVKVEFNKVHENGEEFHPLKDDKEAEQIHLKTENKPNKRWFWMVKLTYPRRLIDEISSDMEFYDDKVDVDDVQDAKDSGIDDETAFKQGEQPESDTGDDVDDEAPIAPDLTGGNK